MYVSRRCQRRARVSLIIGIGVVLCGCWTPPSASVHPAGEPGIIQSSIAVERVLDSATVASLDPVARTVRLSGSGTPLTAYAIGPAVHHWRDIHIGDLVHAEIGEVLTIYVAPTIEGASPDARSRAPDARVLAIDPSYRLLTLQYPRGERETFKVGLHASMSGIEAGDAVAIRRGELLELRVRRDSDRQQTSRSRQSPASAH